MGTVKAGERRKMLLPESLNHLSHSKRESRIHPGLQTGTSTAQQRAELSPQGRKLRGCGRRSWDNESPGDGLHAGAGALAGVSVLTQKEGGGANFVIPQFK